MTEAEYEKLVDEQLAAAFPRTTDLKGLWAKGGRNSYEHAFKAGVNWSRTHPPPEVQALVEAMSAAERVWRAEGATFLADRIKEVIARFKERTAGDEGEGK